MSFAIYIIGFVILIGGLAYGASLAGLSTQWIVVGGAGAPRDGHCYGGNPYATEGPTSLDPALAQSKVIAS